MAVNPKKKYHFFNKHQEVGLPGPADADTYRGAEENEDHVAEELAYRDSLYNCSISSSDTHYPAEELSATSDSSNFGLLDLSIRPSSDEAQYGCPTPLSEGYPLNAFTCLGQDVSVDLSSSCSWAPVGADETDGDEDTVSKERGKRTPRCQKCHNHGVTEKVKGHKWFCKYRECECVKCEVTRRHQSFQAKSQKHRRGRLLTDQPAQEGDEQQLEVTPQVTPSDFPRLDEMKQETAQVLEEFKKIKQQLDTYIFQH